MAERPNIIVIVSSTLRAAHLGCYGRRDIRTLHIDAFAKRAVRFTRAYPESLPAIPVRRALHTGRRAYPFRDYRPVKWDIAALPGWQPLANDEDTLAENLAAAGYHTGFITDALPYFAPGFNFHRGFYQWEFIRGQHGDHWRSPHAVPNARLARYGDPKQLRKDPYGLVPMHVANTAHVHKEADTTTARVFQWAIEFVEQNRNGQPFYLLIDCFDPHEPWEAPDKYYRLYGPSGYNERRLLSCEDGPAGRAGYTPGELAFVQAQYAGLVTLLDTWFGRFTDWIDQLGMFENTAILLLSDHGTNFCDNPRDIIGTPEDAMYPALMRVPLLVRLPNEPRAGQTCDTLTYNLDVPATIQDLAGVDSAQGVHGQSLAPRILERSGGAEREYITCRYGHSLCYVDAEAWVLMDVDGTRREAFNLDADPRCCRPLRKTEAAPHFERAWERLLADADGALPDYRGANG